MAVKRYVSISTKLALIIVASLVVGIGSISFYFATSQFNTIDRSTETNLNQQSGILYSAIESFMLPGEAPLAENFFSDIGLSNPDYRIILYRTNGERAFVDNDTLEEVNQRLGMRRFEPRQNPDRPMLIDQDIFFQKATQLPPEEIVFRQSELDGVYYRMFKPLYNLPKCTACHGSSHTIRGVLDIKHNITASVSAQRNSLLLSTSLFLGMVLILALFLTQFLKRSVIGPVIAIRDVCTQVTQGYFSNKVNIKNNDEIGSLSQTVNTMVDGLYERFELSKYVSSSTIESLRGLSKEGRELSITLLFSDVRGFTSYSDRHDAKTVVRVLNSILNAQSKIIHECGGDIDKYVGDEIVAFFTGAKSEHCASYAAKRIQEEFSGKNDEKYNGLKLGIGIHNGIVILGMIGSTERADYTAVGDNVNIASRLCDSAPPGEIIISQQMRDILDKDAEISGPFRLKMKGKAEYQRVYKLKKLLVDPKKMMEESKSEEKK